MQIQLNMNAFGHSAETSFIFVRVNVPSADAQ
jgi:hypothetical protein